MTQQIDLYIEEAKKQEASGNIELSLIAELNSLPQDRNAQVTQTLSQEEASIKIANETKKCHLQEGITAPTPSHFAPRGISTAIQWWLALIAFLLFLSLIFKN